MGAVNKKAGQSIPDSLKNLKSDCPAESLTEDYFIKGWRKQSLCRQVKNPDDFFTPKQEGAGKVACSFCPVQKNCLIWALMYKEEGLWGGTTEDERKLFTDDSPAYVKGLIFQAKSFRKWFPLPDVQEIIRLAGLGSIYF